MARGDVAELRREFLTTECLRRVHPEWNGGPIETEIFVGTSSATTTAGRG